MNNLLNEVKAMREEMKQIYLLLCDERIVDRAHLMGKWATEKIDEAKQISGKYYTAGQNEC